MNAMDIRELHIGNHVLLDGERVEIDELSVGGQVGCITSDDWVGVDVSRLSPIPITEELLKELGFEKSETKQYDWYKHIDDFSIFIKIFKRGRCRAEVYSEFSHLGNMVCYWLHELETFVYLTTKQELI